MDYKSSLKKDQKVKFNNYKDYNFFFDSSNNDDFYFEVKNTITNLGNVPISLNINLFNDKVKETTTYKKLIQLFKEIFQNFKVNNGFTSIEDNNGFTSFFNRAEKLLNELTPSPHTTFDEVLRSHLKLKPPDNQEIISEDLQKKAIGLFFYLYSIKEIRDNFSTVDYLKNKWVDQFIGNNNFVTISNHKKSSFLGIDYWVEYDDGPEPLINKISSSEKYTVFTNDGEKITSLAITTSWASVIFVILSITIIVYYRRDFS